MQKVIILIITHKEFLTASEALSLRQCCTVLGKHPIRLICPRGLDTRGYRSLVPDIVVDCVDPRWLRNTSTFARFKIMPQVYEKYRAYEYILFYELDAFVFRDELEYWCDQGYDYIGAPWFKDWRDSCCTEITGAGNGGFSLRKITSHLRVLHSFSRIYTHKELIQKFNAYGTFLQKIRAVPDFVGSHIGTRNNSFYLANTFKEGEDVFWARYIKRSFSWFKVAEPAVAMRFSFEANPRMLYEMNQRQLPFGCHKYRQYQPDFWKAFIPYEL